MMLNPHYICVKQNFCTVVRRDSLYRNQPIYACAEIKDLMTRKYLKLICACAQTL